MRRVYPFLAAMVFCVFTFTVNAKAELTIVSGHMKNENSRSVILYRVIEGKKAEYATTVLDADNNFAFALTSGKEGFYYISDQGKRDFTRIY